ncbi:MAG: hypothetical protein IJ661_04285 [Lachnospiraceae bacterium]|nr:hypothetical protein [Lachnospiraceae bacterium]
MRRKQLSYILLSGMMIAGLVGCGTANTADTAENSVVAEQEAETIDETTDPGNDSASTSSSGTHLSKDDITVNETYENSADGEHAIEADGTDAEYSNIGVTKTGDSEGDEADFYGENASIFATNGATLTITDSLIESDGTHANGVFSYGEGTTVNISDSVIETSGNCSGGIMTTGGGTMNATNLTIHTTGNSSAAIRSDRGGGTVTVNGGSYTTDGTGSPVVYSTADITVNDSDMESTASQGIVVEGKNSVTLNNCNLTADNNTKNSDKSDYYQAVMIYQSMSGDAASGTSSFTMDGGTLTNKNGDIFFVNNTACEINLSNASITNEDSEGIFLRAAAAGWGSEGSNGGKVNLTAVNQTIDGDMLVDDVSALNLYLTEGSNWTGAINSDGQTGDVYVEISGGSTWTLTADSYVSSLTCDADSINLNGYKLYVNGEEYSEGTASAGEAVEIVSESSGNGEHGDAPDGAPGDGQGGPGGDGGTPPTKPDGSSGGPGGDGGTPPAKPDDSNGTSGDGGTPPAKPDDDSSQTTPNN